MLPPQFLVANALHVGSTVLTATQEAFDRTFAAWPAAKRAELWAAWADPKRRPQVRLEFAREQASLPCWLVRVRGGTPAADFAGGGRRRGPGGTWTYNWVTEYGVEVKTTTTNAETCHAWWWLAEAALNLARMHVIGSATAVGLRQGNRIELRDELEELAPELGQAMSSWWYVTTDCSVQVPTDAVEQFDQILVMQRGYFADGIEGGYAPVLSGDE
jgi:hypothetical protein